MRNVNEEMKNLLRDMVAVAGLAVVLVLTGCSADEEGERTAAAGDEVELRIGVGETSWLGETFNVTRSGETLEGLKAVANPASPADGEGFSLHGTELLGPTGKRQVIWNASAGQWNAGERIYWKRTSDEDDVFSVYAYAPYEENPTNITVNGSYGVLTFTSADGGSNPDLLYAGATVKRSDGLAQLTFNHALAKMTLGVITNNSGAAMHLTQVSVRGGLYKTGKLNLMKGLWSDFTDFSDKNLAPGDTPASKSLPMTISPAKVIADGASVTLDIGSPLLIPGPTVTASLTFEEGASFSFTTKLEQGKAKTFNMTVGKNFEVEIAD
jgi:hypothetical protein